MNKLFIYTYIVERLPHSSLAIIDDNWTLFSTRTSICNSKLLFIAFLEKASYLSIFQVDAFIGNGLHASLLIPLYESHFELLPVNTQVEIMLNRHCIF